MRKTKRKFNIYGKERKSVRKFEITGEVLPPGTLKRNPTCFIQTPKERWEEIVEICAEVVVELIEK